MTKPQSLAVLADQCANGTGLDNALDVMIETALLSGNPDYKSVRPNANGTKVIYRHLNGNEAVHWAEEWTGDRIETARLLRHLANHAPATPAAAV